jgi:hypothetical protein
MTSNSLAASTMPGWIKGLALTTVAFAVCWAGAITYWRAFDRMPSTVEMALSLVALPLVLILAFWIGRSLFKAGASGPTAALPATAAKTPSAPMQASALAILAASLRSPHGASPEELAQAIASNKARADLDPELVDQDGFPAMTARCHYATDEALQEEIMGWLAENGMADLAFNDEQWRALTLATGVAGDLASQAANSLITTDAVPPLLQLMPILPAEWSIAQHRAAGMWIKHTVSQFGWPPDRISLPAELTAVPDEAAPTAVFRRLAQEAAATDASLVAMVVACASHIGEQSVAQWAESGMLFTSSNPKGAIPGEGAAGVLVTDMRQAQLMTDALVTVLDAIEQTRRDSSADDAKRANPKLLGELTERAIARTGAEAAAVSMIVADTGHRSTRTLELMGQVSANVPHLDNAEDVVRIGLASGTCAAVPFMTALALARHYTLEREAPVLFVSNEDPFERAVAVIRPPGAAS